MFTGTSKKLTLVAPLFNPFNYRGYCTAFLDSKPVDRKRKTMRDNVKIFFDTMIKDDRTLGVSLCKDVDEDPFNNCEPINCAIHYNGIKPFFNNKVKRCVGVPKCISKDNQYLPNVVYDPRTNKCLRDNTVKLDDYDYVKSLTHQHNRVTKDIVIVKKTRPHLVKNDTDLLSDDENYINSYESEFTKNFKKRIHVFTTDTYAIIQGKKKHKYRDKIRNDGQSIHADGAKGPYSGIAMYLSENLNTFMFLSAITVFQICLLGWLIYYLSISVFCRCKKKLERQYYNYRQDVSVTTPLIGTSNMETETTCQFMSESSNIDKKIQCYKSCQRDQAKISLSDDILSKCLNRRKWELKQTKSHNMEPEFLSYNDNADFKSGMMRVSEYQQYSVYTNNAVEQKISYENEKAKAKKSAKSKSSKTLKKSQSLSKTPENKTGEQREYADSDVVSSERVLKCHSFNYMGEEPLACDRKVSTSDRYCDYKCCSTQTSLGWSQAPEKLSEAENVTGFRPGSENRDVFTCTELKLSAKSHSTEKGAQASFTNDSLDDFLSERGMIFLTGEDISKYSNESDLQSLSSISSKTSKNQVLKNVLSLFRKKSKQHVSSDPGFKNSKENINLELIHMSRPTVYSSSNVGSENTNLTAKKTRDSRSSL